MPSSNPSVDFEVVVTSCGRFDLLRRSMESLVAHLDVRPRRILVIEDSGDAGVHAALAGLDGPFEVVVNPRRLGQMATIDKAYTMLEAPYVFHTEDDWQFERSGFVEESAALLEARADYSMIGLRPRSELNPLIRDMPEETIAGVRHFALDPTRHPEYFSHSFNPGLRRLADARAIGPFDRLGGEEDVSYAFKKRGFRIANLAVPACRHIGDDRHVDDPTKRRKARTLGERLARSVRKRWKRLRRRFGGA